MTRHYEAVVGLELHAQLATEQKAFCSCDCTFDAPANTLFCPVCSGISGALPVLNPEVIPLALRVAIALSCTINQRCEFDRKHYVSSDLPKGYQITQHRTPLGTNGWLPICCDIIADGGLRITRAHIEEDAAKTVTKTNCCEPSVNTLSAIDLNRCGIPLVEIVTEPKTLTGAQVAHCMREFRKLLMSTGACDGEMQNGSLRCDVNVSVRECGSSVVGQRTEIKNLNSFRFAERAVQFEFTRQSQLLERGERVQEQTLGWDERKGRTYAMRQKTADYRYVTEPDLAPVWIDDALIAEIERSLPTAPYRKREHYTNVLEIPNNAADVITSHPAISAFFDAILDGNSRSNPRERDEHGHIDAKVAANWLCNEMMGDIECAGLRAMMPVEVAQARALLSLLSEGKISTSQAKQLYAKVKFTHESVTELAAKMKREGACDDATIRMVAVQVLRKNERQVQQYQRGKEGILGYFVAQVRKETNGRADPQRTMELLRELLREQRDSR